MLSNITWVFPWVLWLLPLPLLVYRFAPAKHTPGGRALLVPNVETYTQFTDTAASTRNVGWIRPLLLVLVWVALLLSVARPQHFGDAIGVPVSGRDLMLGIDISGSMREADLYAGNTRATRMAVVKQVAKEFVARRTGDRVGLIMFGSQAYVQTPLTHDHKTVQHFLDEATVGLAGRSTAIGDAIGLAVKRLRDKPDATRVLILLTDGANSAGVIEPIAAAKLAAQSDIRIHSIGVGSQVRENLINSPFGARRSELDESTLRAISAATGGQYFRARNQQELANIYLEIDKLEPTELESEEYRPLRELFVWPLGAALVLSIIWVLSGLIRFNLTGDGATS
ncbi:MAG: Ca-activated chloride channel family protein [Granulosicoccus sp.]|jgi:Ca-activated chloride channel family protein